MADSNFLTVKYGPLPAYAWIGIAVAALLVYDRFKTAKATKSGTGPNTSSAGPNLQAPGVTLIQEGFQGPYVGNQTAGIPQLGSDHTGYVGSAYVIQPGDTLQSIMKQYYGNEANNITARILTGANPSIQYSEKAKDFILPQPGTTIYLTTNGIAGVQPNSLTRYDPGHELAPLVNR